MANVSDWFMANVSDWFMANVADGLHRGRSDYQPANNPVAGKSDIGKDYTVQGLLDNLEEIVL
jgi:hypothetical protein